MKLEKLVQEIFNLAHVDYSQEDAMCNNPAPEEVAIKLLEQEIQTAVQETIKAKYVWCEVCGVQKLLTDDMGDAVDLVCDKCHLVISTLHKKPTKDTKDV